MSRANNDNQAGKGDPDDSLIDEHLQRELDEALGDMSLEDLLQADEQPQSRTAEGGIRSGTVVAVHGEDVFVDMGQKSQGVLPLEQFEEPPKEGDAVEVTIEGYDESDGLLLLSRKGAVRQATWETLEEGQMVEGRVTGHNKGGLELLVNGIRAFMPISQIETYHLEDISGYVGERLHCVVMEVDEAERNVILSRRELLLIEAAEAREKLFETLQEGQLITGVVASVVAYGAFVDIGGVDALLHVSNMSYTRVEDPAEIVQQGQKIEVEVLKVDREERKISVSLKHVMLDPWEAAETKWPPDSVVTGRITRLAEFGAFVELEPGAEGLIPISELSFGRRIRHPGEIVSEGDMVKTRVLSVDRERRRISLSLKRIADDPWLGASVRWPAGSTAEGIVTRIADFGAFMELTPGVEGLIHISELSHNRVRSVEDIVREGDTVQAIVLSVDEDKRRISLSIKDLGYSPGHGADDALPAEPQRLDRKRKRPLKGGLD